jgi:hemolysin III
MREAAASQGHSLGEEIANTVTHALGTVLALVGLGVLLAMAAGDGGSPLHLAALGIYGATLVLLYLASTLYHVAWDVRAKRALKVFDHSAIFLLIAGTYTPLSLISISGFWGTALCVTVWLLAVGGVAFKLLHKTHTRRAIIPLYLIMGWLGIVALIDIWSSLPMGGLTWLAIGGLLYTGGVVFYVWDRLPYNHAVWHLFVLAGSGCHFAAVWMLARPGIV